MTRAVWQGFAQDTAGNVLENATIDVFLASDGTTRPTLYEELSAGDELGNPFTTGADGFIQFYMEPEIVNIVATSGANTVTFEDVVIGMRAQDVQHVAGQTLEKAIIGYATKATLQGLAIADLDTAGDGFPYLVLETTADSADAFLALWRTGDQSSNVTNYPETFFGPTADTDGSSGAFEITQWLPSRLNNVLPTVDSYAALTALTISGFANNTPRYVKEGTSNAKNGALWLFKTGDQSSNVTADPALWKAPDSPGDGSTGAWTLSHYDDNKTVATEAALTALDLSALSDGDTYEVAEVSTDSADGYKTIFRSGDQSSNVTNDPYNWKGPDDDSDGSSGAWQVSRPVPQWPQINTVTGTTDTLALTDLHQWNEYTNASGCAITVPPESSVAWPDGAEIHGASTQDTCTFVEGSGVTIRVRSGFELEAVTDTGWTLKKVGTNTWRLIGALVETA